VVRFGIPPAAMISALKTSTVVRWRIAICRMSANASSLRHIMTAHDLQNGGEHDAPGSNAILQLFYVCRVFNPSLGGIERNHQRGV
jgi:hypothetical protein